MKQNVMNQTAIFGPNENEWTITNPFWKPWRLKVYEIVMKLAHWIKQVWQKLAGLWILKAFGNLIRGKARKYKPKKGALLFQPPPQDFSPKGFLKEICRRKSYDSMNPEGPGALATGKINRVSG